VVKREARGAREQNGKIEAEIVEKTSVLRVLEANILEKTSVFRAWADKFESEAKIVEKTSVFQRPRLKY